MKINFILLFSSITILVNKSISMKVWKPIVNKKIKLISGETYLNFRKLKANLRNGAKLQL